MKLGRHPEEMKKILKKVKSRHRIVNLWSALAFALLILTFFYSLYAQFSPLDWPRIPPLSPDKPTPLPPPVDPSDSTQVKPPTAPTSEWCQRAFRVVCGNSSGSGFLITPEYVLTNAHVVDGCNNVTLHFDQNTNRNSLNGNVVWRGNANGMKEDLAIIQVPEQDLNYVMPLGVSASDQLPQGSDILVVGYQLGEPECAMSKGTLTTRKLTRNLLVVDATMNMGHSGGPTISSEQNAVVGVNVSEADGVTPGGRVIEGVNNSIEIDFVKTFVPGTYLP